MPDNKQVVLVTGANSGIGKAVAEHLASRGFRVFAGARRPGQTVFGQTVEEVALDVTDDASVEAAVRTVSSRAGRVDVLVNNAGGSILGAVEETSLEQARQLFDTNFFGALRMSLAVLPDMRRRNRGTIVNISSVVGFLPAPYMGVYAASKHALEGLSESMDHEVRGFGVRVMLVEPGFTRTNIGTAAARAASPIAAYDAQRDRVLASIGEQIARAPEASSVARVVERAIRAGGFARLPVGGRAKLLSRLRKWMPAGMVDGALRKSFALDG